jgi:predicted branched-subunit amino acid permease
MLARTGRHEFFEGARLSLPVVISSLPFALLFGAIAVDNGLTIAQTVLMSATIYGGASQMVGIELFGQHVAPWLVVASILAVNFRHVLYSAAVGRRIADWPALQRWIGFFVLVDPQYAETERRAERGEPITFVWYIGLALPVYVNWVVCTWIGAVFGGLVPDPHALGLDFLLPIYFLGLVMEFRERRLWLPVVLVSAVASVLAAIFIGSPWHISVGALAGIGLAAAFPHPHMDGGDVP